MSPHFTLDELTYSETALRRGMDNSPTPEALDNLRLLAAGLEQVRALLDCPIIISSGYRSPELNAYVGGSKTSAHCEGFAADFIAPGFGAPEFAARAIANSQIAFDQLIHEGRRWVHISFKPQRRRQVLTARFSAGRVRYTPGIA